MTSYHYSLRMILTSASPRPGLALRLLLATALCVPLVALAAAPAQAMPGAAATATYEARVLTAVNVQRAHYGRRPLASWSCIDRYAESWSAYLARTGLLVHRSMRTVLRGCAATRVAENLARGGVGPERVVALWMASPPHRANLLDGRLADAGVAATFAGGAWTVVLELARP